MRLGKRQAGEVASMLSSLLESLDRENSTLFDDNRYEYMKRQITHSWFSRARVGEARTPNNKLHRQRRELYANMAKRGIITGSDEASIHTYLCRGKVVYHEWYFLSPAQLEEYLNHDAVKTVLAYEGAMPHQAHWKTWDMIRKYIAGEGEIKHLNGHTRGSGFPLKNTLGKK